MRILTAIMFTDIEGFTSLMQRDEASALKMLEQHKKIFLHCIEQHKGRVIKYLGDGTLTIFNSVLHAVDCAVALQQALRKDPVIPVRIGIHTGEVIFENKDIIGDAVNLASRIQTKGIAGSVLISEKVYEELINHPEIQTVSLGPFQLKNVMNPVKLYAIATKGLQVPSVIRPQDSDTDAQKSIKSKALLFGFLPVSKRIAVITGMMLVLITAYLLYNSFKTNNNPDYLRTIAVLPFKNIGKDVDNYLAEGLTEEMISLLSKNPGLTVKRISPEISGRYSDKALAKILTGVQVGCVLEGSIMEGDNNLLIIATLRDIRTNQILWANTFKEQPRDLINVQQYVALQINDALKTGFSGDRLKPFDKTSTNPEAHDLYLRGRSAQKKRDYQSMQEANYYFRKALEKDPNYTLAYSGISDNYVILIDNGYLPYDSGVDIARNALGNAFRLDSNIAEVRASKAIFLTSLEGRRHEAMSELKAALALAPNYTEAHQWYAIELAADGQFDSALVHINKAMELDPFSERIWDNKIMILTYARRYEDAIKLKDSLIAGFSNKTTVYEIVTECYFGLGKKDSSLIIAQMADNEFYQFWRAYINDDKRQLQVLIDSSIKDPENANNETIATYYTAAAQYGNAIATIKNAYDAKEFAWLKFLYVDPIWDPLRNDPGFQNLLISLGFR